MKIIQFFSFLQFPDEEMIQKKIENLYKTAVEKNVISQNLIKTDKETIKSVEGKVVENLIAGLQPFISSLESQFEKCFYIPENIPLDLTNNALDQNYTEEDLALKKTKYEKTLQMFLQVSKKE